MTWKGWSFLGIHTEVEVDDDRIAFFLFEKWGDLDR